jgi:YjjI family glycine radical enzyme
MENVRQVIGNSRLEYHEKRNQLAYTAENSLPYVAVSEKTASLLQQGILCDIFEGHAPYRPRYILPDYQKFMRQGSEYLNLAAPATLYEAVNALLILYRYVPSITGYPVYLGQADELLEPYKDTVSAAERENLLRMYLIHIDRTLPDAFVHMNIGPRDTVTGRMILQLERECKKAVPNLSLKYSTETPDDFAKLALNTALTTGKPYFVNHPQIASMLSGDYGIASCYNTLPVGGGSHTLVRLNLKKAAQTSTGYADFLERILPETIRCLAELINARAAYLVEETRFFESSFLAREGLIELSRFTSMAGLFGLYECVEFLSAGKRMGFDEAANHMAMNILQQTRNLLKAIPGAYCQGTGGKIGLHAQSGIDSDLDVTAGVRIQIGSEPPLFDQLHLAGILHAYFDTGVSDICLFDQTASTNPDGLLTIVKGAMKKGVQILAINRGDSELVRITGYLVKRTDIEKHFKGERLREDTIKLGADSVINNRILERVVRKI